LQQKQAGIRFSSIIIIEMLFTRINLDDLKHTNTN